MCLLSGNNITILDAQLLYGMQSVQPSFLSYE